MSMQSEAVDQEPVGIKEEPIQIDVKVKEERDDEFLEILPSTSKCIFDDDRDVPQASLKIEPEHDSKILPRTSKIECEDDLFEEDRLKKEKSVLKEEIMSEDEDDESDFDPEGLSDDLGEGPSTIKTEELMIKSESGDSDTSEIHVIGDEDKLYVCDRCNYKTQSRTELTKHERLKHAKPSSNGDFMSYYTRYITRYACDFCEYKTHSTSLLGFHHLDCHETNRRCSLCLFESDNENEYKEHMLSAHIEYLKNYSCDQCDYKCNNKIEMKKHIRHLHMNISRKTHICEFCDYTTSVKGQLKKHIKAAHDNNTVKKYACQQCDYRSPYETYLKRHVSSNIHRNTSDRYLTKKTCNYAPDVIVDLT